MSGMIAQEENLVDDAKKVIDMGIPLIIGGPVVSESFQLKDYNKVFLVQNEAELVIDSVMMDLANGKQGGFYKGSFVPPEKFWIPDYSSVDPQNYLSWSFQTSRGCPHDCEFCGVTEMLGHKMRVVPEEVIEKAIKQMYKVDPRKSLFFADDNFIGSPAKAKRILQRIAEVEKKIGHSVPKYSQVSMVLADESETMGEIRALLR